MIRRPRPARAELVLVLLIVSCGLGLRFLYPSQMAVEHFDEGVYASNIWFGAEAGFQYPYRHLYAPPLLPWLVEWSIILFGPSPLGTMLVSLLSGSLTIGLVWWTARQWFGAEAGLAAATLCSLSDFHLLYSRAALTDVLLSFWLLAAVYLIWEACRRRELVWGVAAGIATALAWWTKYNGWLPLAIGLAGVIPWFVFRKADDRAAGRLFLVLFTIAVTAVVAWSPVWFGLQSRGGYAAVQANHQQYLVGLTGWIGSFTQQVSNHRYFDGWLGCAGVGLALLAPLAVFPSYRGHFAWNVVLALLITACAAFFGSSSMLAFLAVAGIVLHLRQVWPLPKTIGGETSQTRLAAWLLAAWFCGLLVATPFYTPYPRLTLPWLLAAWLGTAALIGWWSGRLRQNTSPPLGARGRSAVVGTVLLVAAILLSLSGGRLTSKGVPAWQPRNKLGIIAGNIVAETERLATHRNRHDPAATGFLVYVYGEPGLFFHLSAHLAERPAVVQPAGDLGFARPSPSPVAIPIFLVTGPHAHRSRQFAEEWDRYGEQFRQIKTYRYQPSDLVLLDEHHPRFLADPALKPGRDAEEEVRVFLVE